VVRTTLFVGAVKDFEVVVVNVSTGENIGDEFQERGFASTSLSNKKDSVRCFKLVLRCLDDPLLEKLYVAGEYDRT